MGLPISRRALPSLAAILLAGLRPAGAEAPLTLVYVHDHGCPFCRQFDRKIAPGYGRTPEGARAPIRQVEKGSPEFQAIRFARPVRFTPTFVLMREGVELDRIEGYPGEDFFYGLLERMLAKAG